MLVTRLQIFPIFDNICTANVLGMWKKRKGFTPHAGVLFPSEPVSQYRCMNLPKTDDNDRAHIEIMQTSYILTHGQCFFLDKCLI